MLKFCNPFEQKYKFRFIEAYTEGNGAIFRTCDINAKANLGVYYRQICVSKYISQCSMPQQFAEGETLDVFHKMFLTTRLSIDWVSSIKAW